MVLTGFSSIDDRSDDDDNQMVMTQLVTDVAHLSEQPVVRPFQSGPSERNSTLHDNKC